MPVSARLAIWATAAVRGYVAFDDALDAVSGGHPHVILGLPVAPAERTVADPSAPHPTAPFADTSTPTRLATVLIDWRRLHVDVRVVLPVPGDVRGVPAAPDFLTAVLAAGQGVYGGGVGLVPFNSAVGPSSAPPTTSWHAFAVDEPVADPLQITEAEHDLARAMRETATLLREAQLGGVRGVDAGRLEQVRRVGEDFRFAAGFAGRAAALVTQAERLDAMLDLAQADSIGGAIDRGGICARADALGSLRTTVRRARLAGYNGGYTAVADGADAGESATARSAGSARRRAGLGE